MLPVKTLVKRIRRVVHDTDAITYDDEEILTVINEGVRHIRRQIADNKPEMLVKEPVSGLIQPGERSIELPYRPLTILYVRLGDEVVSSEEIYHSDKIYHNWNLIYKNHTPIFSKEVITKYRTLKVQEANLSEIYGDMNREGTPDAYYVTGEKTVNVYPLPRKETWYEILAIPDVEELGMEDSTPLLSDFDDLLLEFANVRLSITNEYDVSSDSQVMANINSQILKLLHIPPTGITVQSYWSPHIDMYGKQPTRRMW